MKAKQSIRDDKKGSHGFTILSFWLKIIPNVDVLIISETSHKYKDYEKRLCEHTWLYCLERFWENSR